MNIVLIVLLALLIGWAIYRTVQRSRKGGGCCGEHTRAEKRVTVADRNKAHYPYEISLQLGGMTCENCARRVENALNSLEGVWASVRISDRSARLLCKAEPDEALIREAVRGAGYLVTGYGEIARR